MQPPARRTRVLIAEDNVDLASALGALVETEPDLELAGTIGRADALPEATSQGVDVVVLDLNLDGESSLPAMRAALSRTPHLAVVIYSGYDRADVTAALPALGSCEYVSKSGDALELLEAIRRAVAKGAGPGAG